MPLQIAAPTNPKESALSDSTCKICGGPVPSGLRYCNDCDFQQRTDGSASGSKAEYAHQPRPQGERGSLSIFLLVFLVASAGTIGMGLTAMPGVSIPGLRATLGIGAPAPEATDRDWGELRLVKTRVRIRANRNTNSEIVGMLEVGETVRAHFLENNWYAVFDADAREEDPSAAIGYVYAPLLKPAPNETITASS